MASQTLVESDNSNDLRVDEYKSERASEVAKQDSVADKAERQEEHEEPEPPVSRSAILVVLACCLYYAACLTVVTDTGFWRASIIATIGGEANSIWLPDALLVVVVVIGPTLGHVGDTCGRRYLALAGCGFGALGAIVCATAKNINVTIVGSAIFGVGFAILGNLFSIPSEVVSRRNRSSVQIAMEIASCIGVWLGLFAGAGFVQNQPGGYTGWRSNFFFAAALFIFSGIVIGLLYFPVPAANPQGLSVLQRVLNADLVGSALVGCSMIPLLMGLIWGGTTYPWNSAAVISCLVIGCAFLVILGLHQYFIEKDGLFARAMFQHRNYALTLIGTFVEGLVYLIFNAFYGEMTAAIYESRTLPLATRQAAFTWGTTFATIVYGIYVHKTRRILEVLVFGYLMMLTGAIGLACAQPSATRLPILWAVISGIGFASPQVFLTVALQLAVPPEYMGLASAMSQTSRFVGGSIGIAISGAIFTAEINTKLPTYIADAAISAGISSQYVAEFVEAIVAQNITLAQTIPGVTPEIAQSGVYASLQAYAASFKYIWALEIPFVVVGLIGILFLQPIKKQLTATVDRATQELHLADVAEELHLRPHHHEGLPHPALSQKAS
ncbi:MFS general substrate transporter [Calocera viscosa TUFC12733]|uniref:MFS general substrate transporter n=1 Tax=Calocera viscosa (strain TUFC12733) TaxID=1330018 RepID=A0A167HBX6_CALVF|nr:MFS general substrate transporter [Calocera viscosa TUFC12733]